MWVTQQRQRRSLRRAKLLSGRQQHAPSAPPTPLTCCCSGPRLPAQELQQDSSEPGVVFLSNARLRVGIDTNRGGALTHLSSPVMPPEWANVNLINTWDSGRLVQQSYYGCYDGTCWVDRPW